MQTPYLSERERKVGQHHFILYECWNGVSMGLLGDTFINILAVYFFASNFALGYISSALYITALAVPLVLPLLKGKNMCKIMYVSWYLRGFVCVGHVALLFLEGQAAVIVLLIVYTLYATFRSISMVMYDAMSKSITTLHNRGAFYAHANMCYNGLMLVTKLFAVFALEYTPLDALKTITTLQLVGVLANSYGSYQLSKVPCRINFDYSKSLPMKTIIKNTFRNSYTAKRIWLRFIQVTIIVMMGMNVPFMSKELCLSNALVVLFTGLAMAAYVVSGMVSAALSDKMGSKPLLISASILFIFASLCWAFFPLSFGFIPFFIVGFLTSFSMQLVYLLSTKLTADVIPEKGAGSFTVLVTVGMAIFSLIGALFAGILTNIGETIHFSELPYAMNNYSLCFLTCTVLSIVVLFLAISMKEKGARSTRMLFSRHGLHAVSTISHLESAHDPLTHRRLIMELSENSALIAEDEVRAKLKSPYSRDASDIIRTLKLKPNRVFLNDLCTIATNDDSYVQVDAISALGSYTEYDEAARALLNVLHSSKWNSAKSEAAQALSKFKNSGDYLDEVMENARKALHIDNVLDYLVALRNMDDEKLIYSEIFRVINDNRSMYFRSTVYAFVDTLISDETPRLARIYEHIRQGIHPSEAFNTFLEDLRGVDVINSSIESIVNAYKSEDMRLEIDISLKIVENANFDNVPKSVKKSLLSLQNGLLKIRAIPPQKIDQTDVVALTYFASLLVSLGTFIFPYK